MAFVLIGYLCQWFVCGIELKLMHSLLKNLSIGLQVLAKAFPLSLKNFTEEGEEAILEAARRINEWQRA